MLHEANTSLKAEKVALELKVKQMEECLGTRNIVGSLVALFSIYHHYAYDLELSSYTTSLVYEPLCLNYYATYVVRLVNLSYGGGSLYSQVCPCPCLSIRRVRVLGGLGQF
jgi:hypothetical protein